MFERDEEAQDEVQAVFVRALDLPTANLKTAREAVRLQLDILSPLPAERTLASLVALGPGERGAQRFAVGLADAALFETGGRPDPAAPAWIELTGDLDGETLVFRFDNPHRSLAARNERAQLMRLAAISGLCVSLLLGAASLRLDREIGALETRAEAAQARAAQAARQRRQAAAGAGAAAPGDAAGHAMLTSCAFELLASPGGEVLLTDLSVAEGMLSAGFARPLGEEQARMLAARGVRAAPDDEAAGRRVVVDQAACR